MKKNNMVKTVSWMMVIMLIGKVLGLLRGILHSATFGTSSVDGTAFYYASLIPRQFLDIMFASVISASFIPIFNGYLEKKDKASAYSLANKFLSLIIVLTTVITIICIIFSPQITALLVGGVTAGVEARTVFLLRIMFPTLIMSGVAFSLIGVLQSLGEFNIPAAMSVFQNAIIIFYYVFLLDRFGVLGLSIAFLIGWSSQILIQIPFLIKNGFKFKFSMDLKDEGIREIFILMIPVMLSTWVQPVNFMVNQKAAAHLFDGNEAGIALGNANELFSVITGVFILSLANVIFPELSKLTANDKNHEFGVTIANSLRNLFFFLIPMTFGLMILSEPIIRLFYQWKNFHEIDTVRTARALFYFSIGIIGFGIQTILLRGFYAIKDGKTPLITGVIAMAINLFLSFTLVRYIDVGGVALASSISMSCIAIMLLVIMCRKYKNILNAGTCFDIIKMMLIGIVMGICVLFVKNYLSSLTDTLINRLITVTVPVIVGMVVYFSLAFMVKLEEAKYAFGMVGRVLKWKK